METLRSEERQFCIGDRVIITKSGVKGIVADAYQTMNEHICVVETEQVHKNSYRRIRYKCRDSELNHRV